MIDRAREIVGSSEIRPLAVLATYEDFDSPTAPQRYTETLYKADNAGYFLLIGRDLLEVSQGAAFSWLNKRGYNDLVIDLSGSEDSITIQDWYANSAQQLDVIRAGGSSLYANQVDSLVNAMAAFGAPAGGELNLTQTQRDQLNVVIAANWQ